jgi:hypothetical protein
MNYQYRVRFAGGTVHDDVAEAVDGEQDDHAD